MCVALLAVAAVGCAGAAGPIRSAARQGDLATALRLYQEYTEARGLGDADLLAEVAAQVLRDAAGSDDVRVRAAGFSAIAGLGSRGRDLLEALAERPGVVGDRAAAALYELNGRSGAAPARLTAALRSRDRERRAAGMVTLRGPAGARRLTRWLRRGRHAQLRASAARALARWRGDTTATEALVTALRDDPDAMVRAAAAMALGGRGEDVADALLAALEDRDGMVRMAVPSALMAAAPGRAREALAEMLVDPPTALAVEAGRVLVARGDERGDAYLLRVMSTAAQRGLRAQAAVGAIGMATRQAEALQRLMRDDDHEVALRVASALAGVEATRQEALAALRPMARLPDGFVAVRALAVLARHGDATAADPIREALESPDATVRRLAVLAWSDATGASGDCDPLVPRLRDDDRSVALLAAVEIVLIAAR
jgi:HEAT repeat protein